MISEHSYVVPYRSIHHHLYTDMTFMHLQHITFQSLYLWDPALQNKCKNKIVMCKQFNVKINEIRLVVLTEHLLF